MCLCEETAKQEGREGGGEKAGVEGGEREESTPKLVAAGLKNYLHFKQRSLRKGRWTDKANT